MSAEELQVCPYEYQRRVEHNYRVILAHYGRLNSLIYRVRPDLII